MADSLKWMFELIDKMSGPAKQISKQVASIESALKATSAPIKIVNDQLNKKKTGQDGLAEQIGSLGKLVKAGGIAAGVYAVGSALASVAGGAVNLGVTGAKFALGAASFAEDSLIGLEAITKSKDSANRIFDQAIKLADETPFQQNEIVGVVQGLLSSGFGEGELDRTVRALADIASVKGDASLTQRLALIMAQVKGKGRLQGEELMQLSEAGLPMAQVIKQLSKSMKKSTDEVQKLITAGKVDSNLATEAIISAVETNFGGASAARSKSLTGLLSTLQDKPTNLVTAALRGGGGMAGFADAAKGVVQAALEALDVKGTTGAKFIDVVNDLGIAFKSLIPSKDTVKMILQGIADTAKAVTPELKAFTKDIGATFGRLFGGDLFNKGGNIFSTILIGVMKLGRMALPLFEGFVNGISGPLKSLGLDMSALASGDPEKMRKLFGDIGTFAGNQIGQAVVAINNLATAVNFLFGIFSTAAEWYGSIKETIKTAFNDIGGNVVTGFIEGMIAKVPLLGAAVGFVFGGVPQAARTLLQEHSPSKVFAGIGANASLGFIEGLQTPDIGAAVNSAIAIPGAGALGSIGGASNTSNVYNVSVPLNLSGADTETAKAAEAAVERLLTPALAALFEGMAAELGAT
jgi:tape measure domain-containing protein